MATLLLSLIWFVTTVEYHGSKYNRFVPSCMTAINLFVFYLLCFIVGPFVLDQQQQIFYLNMLDRVLTLNSQEAMFW